MGLLNTNKFCIELSCPETLFLVLPQVTALSLAAPF